MCNIINSKSIYGYWSCWFYYHKNVEQLSSCNIISELCKSLQSTENQLILIIQDLYIALHLRNRFPLNYPKSLIFKILSVMSNLKTYFKNVVSVCKKAFAYVKVVPVLINAVCHRLTGNGYFEVSFTKIGRKWYCDVPGFPKELFEHTLMVGGASKFLDYYSRGDDKIKASIKIANEMDDRHFCGSRLYKPNRP